jgi:aminoglycoside phosphotransferase (APT) family kinase protein
MDADASANLLAYLREATQDANLDYAEAPTPLTGGFETRTYALRLHAAAHRWTLPLVLRIFPREAAAAWMQREHTVHRVLRAVGFPVPNVLLACENPEVLGGAFLAMERLAGTDMFTDLFPRRLRRLTPMLAALQARLHGLAPADLIGTLPTIDEPLRDLRARIDRARLDGFQAGVAWLGMHRPEPRALVVCHGDFHPRNVLMHDGVVTGVIDWSLALVADPAFEVGSTRVVLAFAPTGLPAPLARFAGLFQRAVVARRYYAQYRRRRAVDDSAVRYYEAFRSLRCLVWAGESRRLAEGMSLRDVRPGPWDAPHTARLLGRHFHRLTGVRVDLPA